jgi:hypothetical protein
MGISKNSKTSFSLGEDRDEVLKSSMYSLTLTLSQRERGALEDTNAIKTKYAATTQHCIFDRG